MNFVGLIISVYESFDLVDGDITFDMAFSRINKV